MSDLFLNLISATQGNGPSSTRLVYLGEWSGCRLLRPCDDDRRHYCLLRRRQGRCGLLDHRGRAMDRHTRFRRQDEEPTAKGLDGDRPRPAPQRSGSGRIGRLSRECGWYGAKQSHDRLGHRPGLG